MIYRKNREQSDRKTHPLVGLLLFVISIILLLTTGFFGLIYGIFYTLIKRGFRGLGEFLLQIAISIDQLGNVLMQHLLNLLWIKKGGYAFGNRDETISSALGRNKRNDTLSGFGKAVDAFLDWIDPNHSLNSIDYYIEPTDQIIEAVSWVHLKDGRILGSRSEGNDRYYIPGGKPLEGEGKHEAVVRETKEEMGVSLKAESIEFLGVFEAQADGQPPGILVRLSCYTALYSGDLKPSSEVREIVWLTYSDRHLVAPADQLVFDFLYQRGTLK
ncbi:NUDIX hydrolase [Robiginitalea aurantiaca]|uniref:NUDIX domain-containing protein n=1 Tax=Robiginitalea aurantiaca TaxID=3056915 RepID=A0ABT7WDI4_9FLAO|nr:NUDIX domain-containing protein [Robiginitalea aurantiaca]MDM9630979.1 NUDIX domain-containing protein [Robiginitalea aurantiaca]